MQNLSIYTSAYNLEKMKFDWRSTLENWCRFQQNSGQIVIAVNTSEDDTLNLVRKHAEDLNLKYGSGVEWTIIDSKISYTDKDFDGKIKTVALRGCSRNLCMLLDMDEVIPLSNIEAWKDAAELLTKSFYDAFLIYSVDLFNTPGEYKSLGAKWYLHRNRTDLERGPVGFAKREDGTIDITKSDTTELIYSHNKQLASFASLIQPIMPDEVKLSRMRHNHVPYVLHLGWLNKEQRIRQSEFWAPVWNMRDGSEKEKPLTMQVLNKIDARFHGLTPYPLENWWNN